MPNAIQIEIIYAIPTEQFILSLSVTEGCLLSDAIQTSGILARYPEIDLSLNKVGIFSKLKPLDTPLRDKDRIEIYRPLIADPKVIRKQRAAQGKKMKKQIP